MWARTTRRRLLAPAALLAPGLGLGIAGFGRDLVAPAVAAQDDDATPSAIEESEVAAPDWRFAVLAYQDPYAGEITRPEEPRPGTRYVGAEVVITNGSDQPMEFSSSDITLTDESGVAYAAGTIVGSEPRLVSQNLPDGERTRGWVWFSLPEDALAVYVRFTGPPPVFRIRVLPS